MPRSSSATVGHWKAWSGRGRTAGSPHRSRSADFRQHRDDCEIEVGGGLVMTIARPRWQRARDDRILRSPPSAAHGRSASSAIPMARGGTRDLPGRGAPAARRPQVAVRPHLDHFREAETNSSPMLRDWRIARSISYVLASRSRPPSSPGAEGDAILAGWRNRATCRRPLGRGRQHLPAPAPGRPPRPTTSRDIEV